MLLQPYPNCVSNYLLLRQLLNKTGIHKSDVAQWELNEAFSTVGIANTRKLGLDASKVNPFGGAVSMGHPLGYFAFFALIVLVIS